jgi:hypothetical protein
LQIYFRPRTEIGGNITGISPLASNVALAAAVFGCGKVSGYKAKTPFSAQNSVP